MTETHTCPRRMSDFGPWERTEGLDTYKKGHGIIGQPRGCSFCGSMHPDDFMDAVRSGLEIGPTDKPYKLYVHGIPNDKVGTPRVTGSSNSDSSGLTYYRDLPKEHKRVVKAEYKGKGWPANYKEAYYRVEPWGPTVEGKFYTSHLSSEQGWEFHRLWSEHSVNWGYPGAPYRPLYIPGPSEELGK